MTLVGVPGIGKSRLVAELGHAVEDDEEIITWRYGRCLPYGDGVSFWALGEIVKAQAGIHENDDAAATAAKLADAVDDARARGGAALGRASSLEPLVGLVPEDVGLRDRRSGGLRRLAHLPRGARRAATARARDRRPAVGRRRPPRLRRRASSISSTASPLLVVCCARPELLERRPDWGGGKRNALTVSLGPLSPAETARLVESLLGRDPADDELRESSRRAGGRESALRRGVRAHAGPRAATSEGFPTACSGSSRHASTCFRPRRRSCSATPR